MGINMDMSTIMIIAGIIVFILLLILCWRRVSADKAMVITGLRKRVISGSGGFMLPFIETSCVISLENMSMTTDVNEAPSKQGIFVNIVGTAVVKVKNNKESILNAVEQFCSGGEENTVKVIKGIVEQILEGKLRGIVSTLTVEQINEDRASFEQRIEDDIRKELDSMGLALVSYSILKISTQGGYLENRAKPQIAQSKADADIAEAERKRDTEIRTAKATQEGEKAKILADTEIAESTRDKMLKIEMYRAEQDRSRADADVAYSLKDLENKAKLAEQNALLAEKDAIVKEKQLIAEVIKPADAAKYKTEVDAEASKIRAIKEAEAEAEAIRIRAKAEADARRLNAEAEAEARRLNAEAEAQAIKAKGLADAETIRAKGLAEAEAKEKIAEAMAKYGDAAIVEMVVEKLPEIMREVAKPMEQIEKITVIDNGGNQGAAKISKLVTDVAGTGFQTIKDMTGVDISQLLGGITNQTKVIEEVAAETETNFREEDVE